MEASTEVSLKPRYLSALLTVFSLILQAYVRDLGEWLKQYDESNLSSSKSIGSLKKEIAQYKDAETHSTQYISISRFVFSVRTSPFSASSRL